MKIIINGAGGRMGKEVVRLAEENFGGASLAAKVDICGETEYKHLSDFGGVADCIVDFSHHASTAEIVEYAAENNIPAVIATTGQTPEELEMINEAAKKIPIFLSANMSLGVALLVELAKITAKNFAYADIEIIEKHHNRKLDAPSGTALLIADAIKTVREKSKYVFGRHGQAKRTPEEIGIHAVRMGNVIGEHEVIVGTDTQTITLKHEAHSRALFAEGAIKAAEFIIGKPAGLYNMESMING